MDKSCFNCLLFSSCSKRKMYSRTEEFDGMDELFITEFGKNCVDFIEK